MYLHFGIFSIISVQLFFLFCISLQVVIIFILVVIGILCFYLLYLFIDSKRKPVELSVAADEVRCNFSVCLPSKHFY